MSLGCPAGLLALIVLRLDNLEWQQSLRLRSSLWNTLRWEWRGGERGGERIGNVLV